MATSTGQGSRQPGPIAVQLCRGSCGAVPEQDAAGSKARPSCKLPRASLLAQAARSSFHICSSKIPGSHQKASSGKTSFHGQQDSFREGTDFFYQYVPPTLCRACSGNAVANACSARRIAFTLLPLVDLFESCGVLNQNLPLARPYIFLSETWVKGALFCTFSLA